LSTGVDILTISTAVVTTLKSRAAEVRNVLKSNNVGDDALDEFDKVVSKAKGGDDYTKILENFVSWSKGNGLSNLSKADLENILQLLDNDINLAQKVALSTKEIQTASTLTELAAKLKLPVNPAVSSLTPYQARVWYSWRKASIRDMLDKTKSLEEQAKQAFNLRNEIRTGTRSVMKDKDIAEFLNKNEPNRIWEDMITNTKNKGFSGDDVWEEIISSSMKGRDVVDNIFQIPINK
ncbi:MAG: hypothetical protein LBV11_03030, partial [Bacillus cereus]|nr:hypothetical protein [Bacillus cereus]